jgi:hypothetical protein
MPFTDLIPLAPPHEELCTLMDGNFRGDNLHRPTNVESVISPRDERNQEHCHPAAAALEGDCSRPQ